LAVTRIDAAAIAAVAPTKAGGVEMVVKSTRNPRHQSLDFDDLRDLADKEASACAALAGAKAVGERARCARRCEIESIHQEINKDGIVAYMKRRRK
jgi:hypothetical protein